MYLDGHPIPSTPFGVKVGPAGLHAPACAVRGLTETCPFGMLEFEVHGRDAFGNSLQLLPRYVDYLEPCFKCQSAHSCVHVLSPTVLKICIQTPLIEMT